MFEFTIKRGIDLKNALMPLMDLAPTATVINSAKAVSLLGSIPSGRMIAVLQISSKEFDHFNSSIEGISADVDIRMLIRFLNFIDDDNMPLTVSAAVDDNGCRLTVKYRKIGNTPYTFFNMGLIQANDDQIINIFPRERMYDVKVGMASTKFRDIVMDMERRSVDTVSVIITSTHMEFGEILRPDLNECIIEGGDTGNDDPIQFLLRVEHLVLIAMGRDSTFLSSDMVWINGSNIAPPMLNCHVPSIGELSYYFV